MSAVSAGPRRIAALLLAVLVPAFVAVYAARLDIRLPAVPDGRTIVALAALSLLAAGATVALKAAEWGFLLARGAKLRALLPVTAVVYLSEQLAPFRAGEAVRLWWLGDAGGFGKGRVLAVLLADEILEAISTGVLVLSALAAAPGSLALPGGARLPAGLLAAPVLGGILLVALSRRFRERLLALRPRALLAAFGCSVAIKAVEVLLFFAVARGTGLPLGIGECLVALSGIHLAIAVPVAPANAGAFEAGAVAGLALAGVAPGAALGTAVAFHLLSGLPLLAIGLAFAYRAGLRAGVLGGTLARKAQASPVR